MAEQPTPFAQQEMRAPLGFRKGELVYATKIYAAKKDF
jgi:hypothetical protein